MKTTAKRIAQVSTVRLILFVLLTIVFVSTSERDGKTQPVVWTNRYGKARVFGTTFGHSDEMFKDPIFIKLLGNGIRWAATGD